MVSESLLPGAPIHRFDTAKHHSIAAANRLSQYATHVRIWHPFSGAEMVAAEMEREAEESQGGGALKGADMGADRVQYYLAGDAMGLENLLTSRRSTSTATVLTQTTLLSLNQVQTGRHAVHP